MSWKSNETQNTKHTLFLIGKLIKMETENKFNSIIKGTTTELLIDLIQTSLCFFEVYMQQPAIQQRAEIVPYFIIRFLPFLGAQFDNNCDHLGSDSSSFNQPDHEPIVFHSRKPISFQSRRILCNFSPSSEFLLKSLLKGMRQRNRIINYMNKSIKMTYPVLNPFSNQFILFSDCLAVYIS